MNDSTTPLSTSPRGARPAGNGQLPLPSRVQAAPRLATQPQAPQRLPDIVRDRAAEEQAKAEQQEEAEQAFSIIGNGLARWNRDAEPDLGEAIRLLDKLKWAQEQRYVGCLPRQNAVLAGMIVQLTAFLRRLGMAAESGRLSLTGLNIDDIHRICNGLSVCLGASVEDSLFDVKQLDRVGKPLAALNRALIEQAMGKGLPNDIHSNGMLMDILNWESRGLKHQLFSSGDKLIRQLFQASLQVMHQWLAPDGKDMPVTQIDALDTRQLGKCMVQLNTMHRYGLLDPDAAEGRGNRQSPGDVALGLCGGLAAGFKAWRRIGNDNSSSAQWQLETVAVEGVPVTNIANTIKDFVAAGLIAPSAPQLPAIVGKLSSWMVQIPANQQCDRGGQGLGNCCNFLRGMAECLLAGASLPAAQRAALDLACKRMLRLGKDFAGKPCSERAIQTLVNLVSFVKVMHRLGGHDRAALAQLATSLLAALSAMARQIRHVESISGLLAGLVYLSASGLTTGGQMAGLLETLIERGQAMLNPRWPAEGRQHLVEGALLYLSMSTDDTTHQHCVDLLDTLLGLYRQGEDRLPYLKAARHLLISDAQRRARLQPVLRLLLGRQDDVSMAELEAEIARLRNASDAPAPAPVVSPDLPEQQEQAQPRTQAQAETTQKRPGPTYRAPVTTLTTNTISTGMTTADALAAGTYGSQNWQLPKKVASRHAARPVVQATPPVRPADPGISTKAEAQQSLSPRGKPVKLAGPPKSAAKSPGARRSGSAEEEWFALLADPGRETAQTLERLKQLAGKMPKLLEASAGKGAASRSSLHLALATGKPETVAWLAGTTEVSHMFEPVSQLTQLFADSEVLIGATHKKALRAYIDSLTQESRDRIATHFASRLMLVPHGFQQVLRECGMLAGIPVEKAPVVAPVKGRSRKTAAANAVREANLLLVSEGSNSLMLCVRSRRLHAVRTLLASDAGKAEALAQDAAGNNALMYAFRCNAMEPSRFAGEAPAPALTDTQAEATASHRIHPTLLNALRASNPIAAELMALPSVNEQAKAVSKNGENALIQAIQHNCPQGALALLDLPSADEQAQVRDRNGCNALTHAANKGYQDIILKLIALPNLDAQWGPGDHGFNFPGHLLLSGHVELNESVAASLRTQPTTKIY